MLECFLQSMLAYCLIVVSKAEISSSRLDLRFLIARFWIERVTVVDFVEVGIWVFECYLQSTSAYCLTAVNEAEISLSR